MSRTNTRKIKAIELLNRAKDGPSIGVEAFGIDGVPLTPEHRKLVNEYFMHRYKLWSETWIIPALTELVPELKEKS